MSPGKRVVLMLAVCYGAGYLIGDIVQSLGELETDAAHERQVRLDTSGALEEVLAELEAAGVLKREPRGTGLRWRYVSAKPPRREDAAKPWAGR